MPPPRSPFCAAFLKSQGQKEAKIPFCPSCGRCAFTQIPLLSTVLALNLTR
ncbi:Hypothetical protein ETEE_0206 [Edwardsiella anguillarum ET080813]|uniref:Uncharacterized protein n=1 Tax=Edwardsiella anguillarum ET080813 TaxID=667120 RepID=A0A076LLY4_9GAMM|nr:Hypothetical protein ETEE_0206 [Edwardsiella anguillarum ET080813]